MIDERQELMKNISAVLDETIEEFDALRKGDVSHVEVTMIPGGSDAPNGGMAQIAGIGTGKETVDSSDDKESPKDMEKAIPEGLKDKKESKPEDEADSEDAAEDPRPEEYKYADQKGEMTEGEPDAADAKEEDSTGKPPEGKKVPPTQEEEKPKGTAKLEGDAVAGDDATDPDDEDEDGDDVDMEKFAKNFYKMLGRMGMMDKGGIEGLYRSEDEEIDLKKSEDDEDEDEDVDLGALMKSTVEEVVTHATSERLSKMETVITTMAETLEKMSRQPAHGRKSVSGLQPLQKSAMEDMPQRPTLNKSQALDALIVKQREGDKRVTQNLITQFELTGNPELVQDILN